MENLYQPLKATFLLTLLISLLSLSSCSCDDCSCKPELCASDEIVGEWKAFEVYISPGGGEIDYRPYEDEWTVKFTGSFNFQSSLNFCTNDSDLSIVGTYTEDGELNLPDCNQSTIMGYRYFIDDENFLVIAQPCIEACWYRFYKVK